MRYGYSITNANPRLPLLVCSRHKPTYRIFEPKLVNALIEYFKKLDTSSIAIAEERDQSDLIRNSIASIDKKLATLDASLQRADAAFTDGTMDHARYTVQINRLQENAATMELKRATLLHDLAEIANKQNEADKLINAREYGLSMLSHPNEATCNAWLRTHIEIYAAHHRVAAIILR